MDNITFKRKVTDEIAEEIGTFTTSFNSHSKRLSKGQKAYSIVASEIASYQDEDCYSVECMVDEYNGQCSAQDMCA